MTRHCDGTDENLLMFVDPTTGERVDRKSNGDIAKPCDCGRVFDDAHRLTFYPHEAL